MSIKGVLKRLERIEEYRSPIEYHIGMIEPYWDLETPLTHIHIEGKDMTQQEFDDKLKSLPRHHVVYLMRSNKIIDFLTRRG
jgi:hypothetical protein